MAILASRCFKIRNNKYFAELRKLQKGFDSIDAVSTTTTGLTPPPLVVLIHPHLYLK